MLKKYFLISAGLLSLGLGIIGIITPVLPTTPFLLLSAYCFVRSSERLYNWLLNHRVFGKYLYNYFTYHAVSRKTKIMAVAFLWLSIIISIILVDNIFVRILLAAVGIGVSIHLLSLKTMKPEERSGKK